MWTMGRARHVQIGTFLEPDIQLGLVLQDLVLGGQLGEMLIDFLVLVAPGSQLILQGVVRAPVHRHGHADREQNGGGACPGDPRLAPQGATLARRGLFTLGGDRRLWGGGGGHGRGGGRLRGRDGEGHRQRICRGGRDRFRFGSVGDAFVRWQREFGHCLDCASSAGQQFLLGLHLFQGSLTT
jgi:hypothetical protein